MNQEEHKIVKDNVKNCPFCGHREHIMIMRTHDQCFSILCSIYDDGCGIMADVEDSIQEAVDSWNKAVLTSQYKPTINHEEPLYGFKFASR